MKKILILIHAFIISSVAFAQNSGMGNHDGNSSGNSPFSTTQLILGAILIVLIAGGLVWYINNSRKAK